MPEELTEWSPEVVLAAAWHDDPPDRRVETFRRYPSMHRDWLRVVEAARKLAAEGKLGPVETPVTWKPTGDYRPHASRRVWVWSLDAKDGVSLPVLQQKWRSDRGNEEWRNVGSGE
ncbi:MAG: hypothetical protein KGN77_01950 [Xanthomonadaceae bacterium]|nr:hypothetical protein [Xanthomonadaceae bacterium]